MKQRNLLVVVLITLHVVLGMAFPAFAQYTLSLEAQDAGGNVKKHFAKGEDLYLNINLNNVAGVAGCAFTLNYPASVLSPPATNSDGLPVNSSDITAAFPFTQNSTPTHRENSAEVGKIYFAGAEIDTTDGGAKYGAGPIALFTVKLKVKENAAVGNFSLEVTQTELFNPTAGYGQDNNTNGVYDAGDTKGKVPVLVGALGNSDPQFGGDLSDDFPIVLGDQTQPLATLQLFTVAIANELVLDFGPAYGLYQYDQAGEWKPWNTVNPSQMVTLDLNGDGTDDLVAAFPGYGLYKKDSASDWQPINTVDPEKMIAADIDGDGDDELVAGFTGYGLYYYDDSGAWTPAPINAIIPDAMVRYSEGVVCDFGAAYGLWSYNTSEGWVPLNTEDPEQIVAADIDGDGKDELVVSFVGWGLYTYEPVGDIWQQINTAIPDEIIAVDIDGDGNDELVISFTGYGLYVFEPQGLIWQQPPINTVIPEVMIRLGSGIAADFGAAYGLWTWSWGKGWQLRNTADPGQMTVVDIENDGVQELVVSFPGYGLWYYGETNGWQFLNDVIPDDVKPINFYP